MGGIPLPGLKIFSDLSSLLRIPSRPSPLPAAHPTQFNHQARLGFLSAGLGGEWLGPPSYEGTS